MQYNNLGFETGTFDDFSATPSWCVHAAPPAAAAAAATVAGLQPLLSKIQHLPLS
jgi:hypothetical protein